MRAFLLSLALLQPTFSNAAAPVMPIIPSRVGVVAAVRGRVEVRSSDRGPIGSVLGSGEPVYLNDVISTDDRGSLQIILLDETMFRIGPKSSIVINRFVYDPDTDTGEVAVSIIEGIFRFITGRIAQKKPSHMEVNLPAGQIGIYGTMVEGRVAGQESTVILMGPGAENNADEKEGRVRISNEGESVLIQRPGYATQVSRGKAPSPPFQASRALLDELSKQWGLNRRIGGDLRDSMPRPMGLGGSPAAESGQRVAFGKNLLRDKKSFAEAEKELADAGQAAAQSLFQSGASTWEGINAVNAPDFTFTGGGAFTGGAGCTFASCNGTYNFQVTISFSQHLLPGTAWQVFIPGCGGSPCYSVGIAPGINYGALHGTAAIPVPTAPPFFNPQAVGNFTFLNGPKGPASSVRASFQVINNFIGSPQQGLPIGTAVPNVSNSR